MMDVSGIQNIVREALSAFSAAQTQHELEEAHIKYVGKKSELSFFSKQLGNLSAGKRKEVGIELNKALIEIASAYQQCKEDLAKTKKTEFVDYSLPGVGPVVGHLHPTTATLRRINSFFRYYGYSVYEGPEIETNEYNFEKLNLPADHPARELADTLYISEPEWLLRTHTSSVETRAMTTEKLPIRIVVPGKVYRNETSNSTNNSMFYQYEGLVIDKRISMAELKGTLIELVHFLYGVSTKTRFRCKYYPQVEPGAGLDIECTFCHGKGCSVCKFRGWIEALGAGMVHPNVLSSCGINPAEWSGFAFGMGLDRLVMMSYNISDIRKLYSGELVFDE